MNPVLFLLDENVPTSIGDAVAGVEPAILVRQVGVSPDVPRKGTLDPDLLAFAEQERMAIVTFDKDTMPGHVADHLVAGRHTYGVFVFPNGNRLSPGRVAEELVMVWATSQADEWVDRIEFLPY